MSEITVNKTVDVLIPVFRPDSGFPDLIRAFLAQTKAPERIILMHTVPEKGQDTFSGLPEDPRIEVHDVGQADFDHGGTRDAGVRYSHADYVLLVTQDIILEDRGLIERMLREFETPGTASCYARQLPKEDCGLLEARTRAFNYPPEPRVQSLETLETLGIKTYFSPDVCCMYDRAVYLKLGGFSQPTIFNEDMIFAYRIISNGYRIVYCADACVRHSHNYSGCAQFRRNFDLAVSQADHPEIFEQVSSEKEGVRMVLRTAGYLTGQGKPWMLFPLFWQSFMKYAGYFLGKRYQKLPEKLILKITMNQTYWRKKNGTDQSNEM